jgi:predicted unusual protein kinase regulating ubiquinone biosynthesis (AarF/ABC1/UbiB family)
MFMTVRRTWQVGRSFYKHLLLPWVLRRRTSSRAERAQAALEELGGMWVKLGQALALRFDILPADYCLQFFQLLNRIDPFPASQVKSILESELHGPLETLFRSFEWQAHAAASIGQVHRAELQDGTPVAVKIQRPDIRDLIAADLTLMRRLAAIIDVTRFFGATRARALVEEFARWTDEELDYRIEARHAVVLRRNAEGDPLERNPRVYPEYTTSRVLTLEYLDGIPVIDIVAAIRRSDHSFLESLADRGHDPRRIAAHIVWNALNQIYRYGYFHADPHPANLIALAGDAIGYVDFGIVGKLDDQTRQSIRHFAQSLFAGHTGAAVDEFMRFLTPTGGTDVRAARQDLIETMNDYVESTRVGPDGFTLTEGLFEIEMLSVVRAHGMALSPDAVRYLKAVLTAEAMVKELDPRFDLRAHENRFFGRLMELEAAEALDPRRFGQRIQDARVRFERLFDAIESLAETPRDILDVALGVRRRVLFFSALTLIGWSAVLAAFWITQGAAGLRLFDRALTVIAIAGGVLSLALLWFSILEVRRLPSEPGARRLSRYPRRRVRSGR